MPTIIRKFIGGPLDGQLMAVSRDVPIYGYELPKMDVEARANNNVPNEEPIIKLAYEPMEFKGSTKYHQVMVVVGMTGDEVLAKLIDGYKP